ncbi:hypothetical protein [Pseudalkalibacillus caeni]|uniref:DUF3887 domain-containing protein n=1 Tax=Exobacillus caeni TaxID=2574798 RepID=A0A5R9F9N6_9BACL|nr:hypothetical protein [Pseudalkalibacillus caeni]TLS38950.1 hypothetical protein FCL54_01160 [Pseudalkalibacillus caeni]
MKKKISVILAGGLLAGSLGFTAQSITADGNTGTFQSPQNESQEKFKKKADESLESFRSEIINEISSTTGFALGNYEQLMRDDLHKNIDRYPGLMDMIAKIQNKQAVGDVIPYVFLHKNGKKGLVLEKKADGSNIAYQITVKDNKWEITSSRTVKGKKYNR